MASKPKKRSKLIIVLPIVFILLAVGLILYPSLSSFVNNLISHNIVSEYVGYTQTMELEDHDKFLAQAREYNSNMVGHYADAFSEENDDTAGNYEDILNVGPNGQICNVTIDKINCSLPVYHTSEGNLDKGAVHMMNTSFPTGDIDTHTVISAHTAYPTKEFFNRLTEVEIGDTFQIDFLGDTLTFKVSDINVVLPEETDLLQVVPGKTLCTLVTCTPYSINTHRLLVTGQLVEKISYRDGSDKQIRHLSEFDYSVVVPVAIAGGVILILFIVLIIVMVRIRRNSLG